MMDSIEIGKVIKNHIQYIGRAMAFYEDGRDFGTVTILKYTNTGFIITSYIVYKESDGTLVDAHARCTLGKPGTANCGRTYYYYCVDEKGEKIYIGQKF